MTQSHKEDDVRCKGTRTDRDLLDLYFSVPYSSYYLPKFHYDKKKAIEKELGKDRIEQERMERMDIRLKEIEKKVLYLSSEEIEVKDWIFITLLISTSIFGIYKIVDLFI